MGVTLKELLEHVGIQESQLKQRVSDQHLLDVAHHMDKWEVYSTYLGLTPADIESIKDDSRSNDQKKILALQKWQSKNAFKATYRYLVVDVFLAAENALLAEKVCDLLQSKDTTDVGPTNGSGQQNAKRPHSPAVVREPKGQITHNLPPWKPINTRLTLLNISNAIKPVVDWKELGKQLDLPSYKLKTIEIDCSPYGQSRMKDDMISLWLSYDLEMSWEKLCTALDSMGERAVAARIRETLSKM